MMHSKRWGLVAAMVAVAGLALAGCSSTPGTSGNETLTVWSYLDPTGKNGQPSQAAMLTQWKDEFEKKHPNVTVQYSYVTFAQLESKLIAAASSKTGPDAVIFNGGGTSNLALGKVLSDISAQWKSFDAADQFPTSVVHTYDDKVYSVQPYVNLLGLYYNKDMLDSLGLSVPTDLSEFTADMAAAKKAGKQAFDIAGSPDGEGEFNALPWLTAGGFDYGRPTEGSLKKGLNTAAGWVSAGYVNKAASTWGNTDAYTNWINGDTLFLQQGNWNLTNAASAAKFTWGVTTLPTGSAGKIYLGGEAVGVGAFSKQKDLAFDFMSEAALSQAGGLASLKVGSIPARKDLASNSAVAGDANLAPFAKEVQASGATYPSSSIKPTDVTKQWQVVGQAWSSVLAGGSVDSAASSLISQFTPLVQK